MTRTFLCVTVLLGAVTTASAEVVFQPLGDLPGGEYASYTWAVSPDGSVVLGASKSARSGAGSRWASEAFRWTANEGMAGLGDLPGGNYDSFAQDVSADGSIVVGWGSSSQSGMFMEAFVWSAERGMLGLGDFPQNGFHSYASAVSADGSIVVGAGRSVNGVEAFRWTTEAKMVGLGDLPGGQFWSQANDVSSDGTVIAGMGTSATGPRACLWTADDQIIELGDLPGGYDDSEADAISADKSVVVGWSWSAKGHEAFRWTAESGMVGLGFLPGGYPDSLSSRPRDVSADGSVIVGFGSGGGAFLWDADHGMRRLQDVLTDDYGLDLTGWLLKRADGISDDGRVIVGYGINPDGNSEAFRVVIPEPSTLTSLLGFLAVLLATSVWRGQDRHPKSEPG